MLDDGFIESLKRFVASSGWGLSKEKADAWIERQISQRKPGAMTYAEAMRMVADGKSVNRPEWGIFHAIRADQLESDDDHFNWNREPMIFTSGQTVWDYQFDNVHGWPAGMGWIYDPTEEDRLAADWMEYQPPEDWNDE